MESRLDHSILTNSELTKNAVEILNFLNLENIISHENHPLINGLNLIRKIATDTAYEMRVIAPGLTSCVATTLLKLGLCQELSQRVVLEYILKYKKQDISLIFLSNPSIGHKNEDHVLVIIGPVQAPETLYIGKNTGIGCKLNPDANQLIPKFLSINKESVIVDPLLNCLGNIDSGLSPLFEYCDKYNLSHVIGIRSYHSTPQLIENAPEIKNNALIIAEMVKTKISNNRPIDCYSQKKLNFSISQTLFNNPELKLLIKKYDLPDSSQLSLEKGLRNAATNNRIEDLIIFLKFLNNVNAQDTNPKVKRTALHWAAIKGHETCYQLLLSAGADQDIQDAAGKPAKSYLQNTLPQIELGK